MSKRKLFVLCSLMQASYWCVNGSVAKMAVTYMNAMGHSPKLIGIWLLVSCILFFFGGFLLGPISDKIGSQRKVFTVSVCATSLLSIALVLTGKYPWSGIFCALSGVVSVPSASVMDAWVLRSFRDKPSYFGPIRAIGSIAVAVMMLFYGTLLENVGFWIMIPSCAAFTAILLITVSRLPELPEGERVRPAEEKTRKLDVKPLLKNSGFLLTLGFLFFIGLSQVPMYQYTPHIFEGVGGTVADTSLAFAVNAFMQVPTMILSAKFDRFSTKQLLLGTAAIYLICTLVMAFSRSVALSIVTFGIYGAGYGVLIPAMRRALSENSPLAFRTTAQTVGDVALSSVTGLIISLTGGILIENYGVSVLLYVCAAVLVPAAVIACLMKKVPAEQKNQITDDSKA